MAVVSFSRAGDAAVARAKYNGKIVDGSKSHPLFVVQYSQDGPSARVLI